MEDLVAEALVNPNNREAQICAAARVSEMTTKQRHKLAEMGVIPPLISLLHSRDHDAVEATLFALLGLAFGSESCLELLILFLEEDASLLDMSKRAILDAMLTLHNLSMSCPIVPMISASGRVSSLLGVVVRSESSHELTEKSTAVLEILLSCYPAAVMEVASAHWGIRAMVEVVEEGSSQSKEHAAAMLLLVCRSCLEKYREVILREGVMPGLLQLTVDGSRRAMELAQHLLMLLRDSPTRRPGKKHLERIMEEINADTDRIGVDTALRMVEEMIATLRHE